MDDKKLVAVFGATGLIGSATVKELIRSGYSVRIFARDLQKSRSLFGDVQDHIQWDYARDDWKTKLEGVYAVVNLAGTPIFQKWKGNYKSQIINSRVIATEQIVDAISGTKARPSVFVNGSAAGIYGYESWDDTEISEDSPAGSDFWGDLVTAWENSANAAIRHGVRVVNIRTSVVLSSDGGALPQLVSVFRKGIGGPIRPGNQWFPWIHIDDEVGMIIYAIENESVSGPLNASSPQVPRMKEFVNILGETLNKPTKVIIPITILRLMMGEVAEVLAKGKKVVPKRTLELGYKFKQEDLRKALENLLRK